MDPPKPWSLPLDAMTRWHGMMIGMGFVAMARPAARAELGLPDAWWASQA